MHMRGAIVTHCAGTATGAAAAAAWIVGHVVDILIAIAAAAATAALLYTSTIACRRFNRPPGTQAKPNFEEQFLRRLRK